MLLYFCAVQIYGQTMSASCSYSSLLTAGF